MCPQKEATFLLAVGSGNRLASRQSRPPKIDRNRGGAGVRDPIGLPTRPGRSRTSGPLRAHFNRLPMFSSDANGPQRNCQLLDMVLQIGGTVRSNIRFESRWGRQSKLARTLIFLRRNRPSG